MKKNISQLMHFLVWYGFWFAIALALFWPVLPSFSYRDHPFMMMNHSLSNSDWKWFWKMLSYNRTNILLPGDYFAFRPVHMAVLGFQEIFLRYHIVAQGVVNCLQLSLTVTIFNLMAKRFANTVTAFVLTLLWVSQPVGSSIVTWQHITPYILCPAFFLIAIYIFDNDDLLLNTRAKNLIAGICVGLGTLTHEIGVATALSIALVTLLFSHRDIVRKKQLLLIFLLPVVCSLSINLFDYFIIHPTPKLTYASNEQHMYSLLNIAAKFFGAIGTNLFFPAGISLDELPDGFILWPFYNESGIRLFCMAVPVFVILLTAMVTATRELFQKGVTQRGLLLTFLISFFWATFSVCAFRVYSREPAYMSQATYYYTLLSLSLCGMAFMLFPSGNRLRRIIAILVIVAAVANVVTMRALFHKNADKRNITYKTIVEGRRFFEQNQNLCYNGAIPQLQTFSLLFNDMFCVNRPGATPLYLYMNEQNEQWLSSVLYPRSDSRMILTALPVALRLPGSAGWVMSHSIPYGHDVQFTANRVDNFSIGLSVGSNSRSISVKRNMITKSVQGAFWQKATVEDDALDKDTASATITYRLGFTAEKILLFADGRLVSEISAFSPETPALNLILRSTGAKPAELANFAISERPSLGRLQITPKYRLKTS